MKIKGEKVRRDKGHSERGGRGKGEEREPADRQGFLQIRFSADQILANKAPSHSPFPPFAASHSPSSPSSQGVLHLSAALPPPPLFSTAPPASPSILAPTPRPPRSAHHPILALQSLILTPHGYRLTPLHARTGFPHASLSAPQPHSPPSAASLWRSAAFLADTRTCRRSTSRTQTDKVRRASPCTPKKVHHGRRALPPHCRSFRDASRRGGRTSTKGGRHGKARRLRKSRHGTHRDASQRGQRHAPARGSGPPRAPR